MEIKTKYNPEDSVHFMYDNKAVQGTIATIRVDMQVNKKEPKVKVTYSVLYKYEVEVDSSAGFAGNQNKEREKYLILNESEIFSSKEELLKSL